MYFCYSHKLDVIREYRIEGEGSEEPLDLPIERESSNNVVSADIDVLELSGNQQQSCECHVCTAPLMSPVRVSINFIMW